jgi:ABC-type lipoprotein release transport system permease subunit
MIDLLTLFIKIMLVAIVLVPIMNVMIMAVYERINEIGTIAAIGTGPGKILALFVTEGLLLGILGTVAGIVLSLGGIAWMNASGLSFDFGRQKGLLLAPTIGAGQVFVVAVIVVTIAVLGSLQPAIKAARMENPSLPCATCNGTPRLHGILTKYQTEKQMIKNAMFLVFGLLLVTLPATALEYCHGGGR